MCLQLTSPFKLLATHVTLEGSVPSVNYFVLIEVALVTELLLTYLTYVVADFFMHSFLVFL